MNDQLTTEFLEHYGVPGMKWGVRRGLSSISTAISNRRKAQLDRAKVKLANAKAKSEIVKLTADAKLEKSRVKNSIKSESLSIKTQSKKLDDAKPVATAKKSIKDMSDDELRKTIARIQMEQQLSALTAPQKSMGRKFVEQILTDATKKVLTAQTAAVMTKMIGGAVNATKAKDTTGKK